MPFTQRLVSPIFVSRVQVEKSAPDELEWVANHTMTNIILQLSSLARHAEDLFCDLCRSTASLSQRTANLSSKIGQIQEQVAQLDAKEEEVLLHEIQKRNQYRSTEQHDQQVVARITMSQAIQDLYNMCARPPPLDKLNIYRDDGKDCMKYYTDPSYFFELWIMKTQQDIDKKKEMKKKKGKGRKQKRTVQVKPKEIMSKRERNKHRGMGAEFIDDVTPQSAPTSNTTTAQSQTAEQQQNTGGTDLPPPADADLPPPMPDDGSFLPPPPPIPNQAGIGEELPPPPPPPLDERQSAFVRQSLGPPPPPPVFKQDSSSQLPPPPPPPPVNQTAGPPPPPPPPINEPATAPPPPPPLLDENANKPAAPPAQRAPDRSDLLSQIRDGNKMLRKMEERKQNEKPKGPVDVHSMMTQLFVARRQAMEDSDSDDDDYDDDDDDEWDE